MINVSEHVSAVRRQVGTRTLEAGQARVELRGAPGDSFAARIVGVDNDLPAIQASATPSANAAGWNNASPVKTHRSSDSAR